MKFNAVRALASTVLVVLMGAYLCADDEPRLAPSGSLNLAPVTVLNYVTQPVVRTDLKLTEGQQRRIEELRTDLQGVQPALEGRGGNARLTAEERAAQSEKAQAALIEILTPDQVRRHYQIVLQHILTVSGLMILADIPEIAAVFQFDADQQPQLEAIRNTTAEATQEVTREFLQTRRAIRSGLFDNPDLNRFSPPPRIAELAEEANDKFSALLTTAQKQRLFEAVGPPLAGRLTGVPLFIRPARAGGFAVAAGRGGRGGRGGGFVPFAGLPPFATSPSLERPSGIGQNGLAESQLQLSLMSVESVRQELKLAADQVEEHVPFGGDADELARTVKLLDQWLKIPQLARLRQLVLQYAVRQNGPAAPLEFKEVVDGLQLNDGQRTALAEVVRTELESSRHLIVRAVERDSEKRREFEKPLMQRLDDILSDSQRKQVADFLGAPFPGEMYAAVIERALAPRASTRARTATSLGQIAAVPASYLSVEAIRDELQLTDEQKEAIPAGPTLPPGFPAGLPAGFPPGFLQRVTPEAESKMLELLTSAQLQRYRELLLQGGVKSDGPGMIFRYRFAIDALALSEEQQVRLLKTVQEDTRNYLRISVPQLAEKLPALNEKTATHLESILTDDQREKLGQLLGEPAKFLDDAAAGGRQ